jgi:hypothetical protein
LATLSSFLENREVKKLLIEVSLPLILLLYLSMPSSTASLMFLSQIGKINTQNSQLLPSTLSELLFQFLIFAFLVESAVKSPILELQERVVNKIKMLTIF